MKCRHSRTKNLIITRTIRDRHSTTLFIFVFHIVWQQEYQQNITSKDKLQLDTQHPLIILSSDQPLIHKHKWLTHHSLHYNNINLRTTGNVLEK